MWLVLLKRSLELRLGFTLRERSLGPDFPRRSPVSKRNLLAPLFERQKPRQWRQT